MDGPTLHRVAAEAALMLPAARESAPFGEGASVFTVAGRMFAMLAAPGGSPIVNLKCDPPHATALVREFEEVRPGWHMNKRHWITIAPGPAVGETMVEDLVANSYDLVVMGLPRARRPLEPSRGVDVVAERSAGDGA